MFELIKRYLPRLISQQSDDVINLFKIGFALVLLDPIEQSQIIIKELGGYAVIQIHKITNVVMVAVDMTQMKSTARVFSAWDLI